VRQSLAGAITLAAVSTIFTHAGGNAGRKKSVADRLCLSLQVDITKARTLLGWTPPYTVEQGLAATVTQLP
jgi:nucleoside-diphosphate-sugar epimerase